MRHTIACSAGSYFARPLKSVKVAEAVVGGTGILITTFVACLSSGMSAMTFITEKKTIF